MCWQYGPLAGTAPGRKNGRIKAIWAAKTFRNSAPPFSVSLTFGAPLVAYYGLSFNQPFVSSRSNTPVKVPFVTSV